MKKILFSFLAFTLLVPSLVLAADAPTISDVSPLQAIVNVPTTFTASATDVDGVTGCDMLISSRNEGPMTLNSTTGLWEFTWTFSELRTATSIRARCTDTLGNVVNGPAKVLAVLEIDLISTDGDSTATDTSAEVDATEWTEASLIAASPVLIKTQCPGGEDVNHPCRTVYFLDYEGKRHAFPNEKTYFTWYEDFDGVHVISGDMMASFGLSSNVRYHPGTKMVKFPSVNTVYAVAQNGILRAIASEDIADTLYGADWNTQIDDVSEAFYFNYYYGADINDIDDFGVEDERASVNSINDNILTP